LLQLEMALFSLQWNDRILRRLLQRDDESKCSPSQAVERESAISAVRFLNLCRRRCDPDASQDPDRRGPVECDVLRVINGKTYKRVQTVEELRKKGYGSRAAPGASLTSEERASVADGLTRCDVSMSLALLSPVSHASDGRSLHCCCCIAGFEKTTSY
jgi:hypothetical protein